MLWLLVEGNQPINEDDTYAEMSKCHIVDFKYGKIPQVMCVVLGLSRVAEGHE